MILFCDHVLHVMQQNSYKNCITTDETLLLLKDGVERIFFLFGIVKQTTKRQQIRNYMKSLVY